MIRDDNYATLQGWMLTRLGLTGDRLMVYAVIYGFSQDGESRYTAGNRYLREWTGKTENTVHKVLKSLEEDGLIIRYEVNQNGVVFNHYEANFSVFERGMQNCGTPSKIEGTPLKNCTPSYNSSMLNNSSKYKYKNKGVSPNPFIDFSSRNGKNSNNARSRGALREDNQRTIYNDTTIQ